MQSDVVRATKRWQQLVVHPWLGENRPSEKGDFGNGRMGKFLTDANEKLLFLGVENSLTSW